MSDDNSVPGIGESDRQSRGGASGFRRHGFRGHTGTIPISSVTELLAAQRKSGVLRVETPDENVLLELRDGAVVHAASDNAPEEDRLSAILVASEDLDPGVLQRCLRDFGSTRSLGAVLGVRELVGRETLVKALGEQVQRTLARLVSREDARFEFDEHIAREEALHARLHVMALLHESARLRDAPPAAEPSGRQSVSAPSGDGGADDEALLMDALALASLEAAYEVQSVYGVTACEAPEPIDWVADMAMGGDRGGQETASLQAEAGAEPNAEAPAPDEQAEPAPDDAPPPKLTYHWRGRPPGADRDV